MTTRDSVCPLCKKKVENPAIAGFEEFCACCVTEDIVSEAVEYEHGRSLFIFENKHCHVQNCAKVKYSYTEHAKRMFKDLVPEEIAKDFYKWKIKGERKKLEKRVLESAEMNRRMKNPPRTPAERHAKMLQRIRKRIARFVPDVTEEMCVSLGFSDDPGHFENEEKMFRWVASQITK